MTTRRRSHWEYVRFTAQSFALTPSPSPKLGRGEPETLVPLLSSGEKGLGFDVTLRQDFGVTLRQDFGVSAQSNAQGGDAQPNGMRERNKAPCPYGFITLS